MDALFQYLLVCAAVGAASITIAKSRVFARPREIIAKRSAFLGEGISCHYCVSHWLAILVVITVSSITENSPRWYVLIVGVFAIVAGSAVMSGIVLKSLAAKEESATARKLEEARALIREMLQGEK